MGDCTFCDESKFDDWLIAETGGFWVFPTLGMIAPGYSLIVPKIHTPTMQSLPDELEEEYFSLRNVVKEAIHSEFVEKSGRYTGVTGFEHGRCGQTVLHGHYHLLPTDDAEAPGLVGAVRTDRGQISDVASNMSVSLGKPPEYYLQVHNELGEDHFFFVDNPASVEKMYLRILVANQLGVPERANWRSCDPEIDSALMDQAVMRLRPYFE